MANVWVASGSSYITAPTLGDILSATTIRVVMKNVTWNSMFSFLFSQAGSTTSDREFGLFSTSTTFAIYVGGQQTNIGAMTPINNENVDFNLNLSTGAFTFVAGAINYSGTASIGSNRIAGMLFRLGARGADDTTGAGGASLIDSGEAIGDTEIYIDGQLVRKYVMPSSGTNVPDSENSQDGTLQNPSGNDWEVLPSRFIPQGLSLGIGLGLTHLKFNPQGGGGVSGDYSGGDYSEDYNT